MRSTPATVAPPAGVRPGDGPQEARTSVPLDQAVARFEAVFEAICAVEDDEQAIAEAYRGLEGIRRVAERLETHTLQRLKRIRSVVLPELRRLACAADINLSQRTAERRAARCALKKALAGEGQA